jgi:hypothetical protein
MKKLGEFFEHHSFGVALLASILVLVFAAGLIFGALCLEAWILMLLWNAVIPSLWAGAPSLTLWLALGLALICNILFKNVYHKKE